MDIKICPHCLKEVITATEIRPGLYKTDRLMLDGKGGYHELSRDPRVQAAREKPGWFEEYHKHRRCRIR